MRTTLIFGVTAAITLITLFSPETFASPYSDTRNQGRQNMYFFSGGQRHEIVVDTQSIVVPLSYAADKFDEKTLIYYGNEALSSIKASILLENDLVAVPVNSPIPIDSSAAIGLPIWFSYDKSDLAKGGLALLTRNIVVQSPDLITLESGIDGFLKKYQFKYKLPAAWPESLKKSMQIKKLTQLGKVYRISLPNSLLALALANFLYRSETIGFAHPDFFLFKRQHTLTVDHKNRAPHRRSDPLFPRQWHLQNTGQSGGKPGQDINVIPAWEKTSLAPPVTVAIIDSGFELNHPDLDQAWQINAGEIPSNGQDDDGNGYIDDVYGWNFRRDDNGLNSFNAHGTNVSGALAARRNDAGIIGVCPDCKIIPIVYGNTPSEDALAFQYAKSRGARIINNSWGYEIETPQTDILIATLKELTHIPNETINQEVAIDDRLDFHQDVIIVFSMNNLDRDDCIRRPDLSSLTYVIAVSGVDDFGRKPRDMGWGTCLDFIAPATTQTLESITTTDLMGNRGINKRNTVNDLKDKDYTFKFGGTSAAAPLVSGGIALLLSLYPELNRIEVYELLKNSADKVSPGQAFYNINGFSLRYGYGRINVGALLEEAELRYGN